MAVDPNSLTTLAKLQTYLGLSVSVDETILEASIDRASAMVEAIVGRKLKSREYYEWRDVAGRTKSISVRNPPITRLEYVAVGANTAIEVRPASGDTSIALTVNVLPTEVHLLRVASDGQKHQTSLSFGSHKTLAAMATAIDGTTGFDATNLFDGPVQLLHPAGGYNVLGSTAFLTGAWDLTLDTRVDYDAGIIHLISDSWPSDHWLPEFEAKPRSVLLHYTGGYDPIPYDIEQVALEAAAGLYRDRKRDAGVASESLGDYSYTNADLGRIESSIRTRLGSRTRIR